ncbi:MAG TPA: FtsX-like permease family protein, partial [Arenimonas sp.]|nr:FtsX-like permease family protein [Arenimonas sp.]
LGARRFDIRRYFMVENLIVIAIGVALGVVLTYGFNLWLMNNYDVPRLAWYYLPVGALVLFTLGQVAVLGPAGRAAAVSPAIATRSA